MVDPTGLPPDLDISEDEDLTKSRLDRAFGWISTKIRGLESFQPSWLKEVETLRAFGLARINEAIMPAYNRVMKLASFGFLKADSSTSLVLEIDATRVFIITDENQRALFTPTEFVAITRLASPDEWAIARVLSFDAQSGNLRVVILSVSVSPGAHDDWQITASAATLAAASKMLADTRKVKKETGVIKTDTDAIRLSAIAAKEAAEKAAEDANAAALLIQGGPVTSVNGMNKAVSLEQKHIPDLVTDIAARALITDVDNAFEQTNNALSGKASTASVTSLTNTVSGKVAFDSAQTLTASQLMQARKNLGLYASALYSDTKRNLLVNTDYIFDDPGDQNMGLMKYDGSVVYGTGWKTGGYISGGNWAVGMTNATGNTVHGDGGFGLVEDSVNYLNRSPFGGTRRIRFSNNTLYATLTGQQYIHIINSVEGWDINRAMFGSPVAKTVVFRFGLRSNYAGTYSVFFRSSFYGGNYRSKIMTVTVTPENVGKDVYYTLKVTPDVVGMGTFWVHDDRAGISVGITAGCGPTYRTDTLDAWQTGNYIAHSSGTNFQTHTGVIFETFDWGLYIDDDNTGVAPPYVRDLLRDTESRCRRYWMRLLDIQRLDAFSMYSVAFVMRYPHSMRNVPVGT